MLWSQWAAYIVNFREDHDEDNNDKGDQYLFKGD